MSFARPRPLKCLMWTGLQPRPRPPMPPYFRMGLLDRLMPVFCSTQPHRPVPEGRAPMRCGSERVAVAVGKTPYVRFDLNNYSVPVVAPRSGAAESRYGNRVMMSRTKDRERA